jgi:hypothetical protein
MSINRDICHGPAQQRRTGDAPEAMVAKRLGFQAKEEEESSYRSSDRNTLLVAKPEVPQTRQACHLVTMSPRAKPVACLPSLHRDTCHIRKPAKSVWSAGPSQYQIFEISVSLH